MTAFTSLLVFYICHATNQGFDAIHETGDHKNVAFDLTSRERHPCNHQRIMKILCQIDILSRSRLTLYRFPWHPIHTLLTLHMGSQTQLAVRRAITITHNRSHRHSNVNWRQRLRSSACKFKLRLLWRHLSTTLRFVSHLISWAQTRRWCYFTHYPSF